MDPDHAGTGYLVLPDAGRGPGILVLHAWWGLTDHVRSVCDELAAAGYVALAPDLFAGRVATEVDDAERQLAEADADQLAHLTRSSLQTLRSLPQTTGDVVGVLGWSMGASMALWLAARVPDAIAATAVYYGGQDIDMIEARSAFLGHYAEHDAYVDEDGLVLLESELHLDGLDVEFHRYPGTHHWFAEPDRPEHDPAAAALAWHRTLAFLGRLLPVAAH
jgi:carboxymethylenebutenolidase